MKNIENKIYALKDGDHPGIYMSWLDFYPEAEKLELFYSKSFEYQESLIEERFWEVYAGQSYMQRNIWEMQMRRYMGNIRVLQTFMRRKRKKSFLLIMKRKTGTSWKTMKRIFLRMIHIHPVFFQHPGHRKS